MRFSNEGLFDWNLKTNEIYFSPGWKRLLGYEDHEIKNEFSEWERLTRPEDVDASWKMLNELLEGKRDSFEKEFQMRHRDGHWVDILSRANVVFDESGKGVRVVGTHVDITERKRWEEELRKTESLHVQAQKVARLGHWELIPPNSAPMWCEELFHLVGFDPQKGVPSLSAQKDIVHPEDRELFSRSIMGAITDGEPFDMEFRFTRPDGEIRWMNAKGEVDKDGEGNILRVFGTAQDITQFKSVEIALRKTEKRYREIFNSISDIFYRTDREGKLQMVSPSCKKVLGYEPDELVGSAIENLYLTREQWENFLLQLNEKEELFDFENALKAKDGSIVWLSTNAHFYKDDRENVIGIQGVSRDVTRRKRVEAEKKALENQLHQARKMEALGTLAGGIAHDFNNILSSVIGYAELAFDEIEKDTSLAEYVEQILAAGNRAKDLVRQIMTFARQSDEKPTPVRVDLIAKEVLKLLRATIPSSIRFTQNITSNSYVLANPTQIHQIFLNLCTNAAQAMADGTGVLDIHVTDIEFHADDVKITRDLKPGNYLEIMIRDTGCGISKEHLESVFLPYFTTKVPGEGTGLGLAVVHGIVKKCGGEIFVESDLGKGTVFTIYLPVVEERGKPRDCAPAVLPKGKEAVLLVDDEESIVKLNAQILERLGYRVTTRTNSIEALELFRSKPEAFDLVITDMTMPGMTGDKLASELLRIKPRIPIILCTGHNKRISYEKAAAIGIKAFCMKPLSRAELATMVRQVLDEDNRTASKPVLITWPN